jgi:Ni/Fe-hydrogenase subunit HybB-like protein
MSEARDPDRPAWQEPAPSEEEALARRVNEAREAHLLSDSRPPGEVADMALKPMQRTSVGYWVVLGLLALVLAVAGGTFYHQMRWGMGVTGLNRPVMWALYIADFVYFIGIGVAGTFISAVLRVLRFEWRAPITRVAESLTVFALALSTILPIVHLGRSWRFYWLLPYPNERGIWPSYHSALLWDMTAIVTYFSSSILFTWFALLPDLAIARDRIPSGWRHSFFKLFSLGWRGTDRQWKGLKTGLFLFSLAIIPVMIFMHTIVGWDFAMAIQPGWHHTVFGPYFVAGALISGTAAVIIIVIIVRRTMHLEYFVRKEHLDGMGKFLLVLSLGWAYFYFNDFIVPWYGQGPPEKLIQQILAQGRAAPLWFVMLFGNIVLPWATLWSRRMRTSAPVLLIVCLFVQAGMFIERFLIVAVMLGRNELPFDWGIYRIHAPEMIITIGGFAFLVFFIMIFVKLFPIIPIAEVEEGQVNYGLRRLGKGVVRTRAEPG